MYDGANVIQELDAGGSVLARYTQGQGIDEPLSELRSNTSSYYQQDGIGSVTALGSSTGTLANTYTYNLYGRTVAATGTIINPFRYTGREYDVETGIYYYRARYYDSTIGRFIVEDPISFSSGSDNFYRYVDNSPTGYIDPFGLTCTCTYHQSSGSMRCTDNATGEVVVEATGYSGIGPGLNNPAMQNIGDPGPIWGPIPQGWWNIGSHTTTTKGPITIVLTPEPGTDTFGRDDFRIHGDNHANNHTASHGCIVLGPKDRRRIADCGGGKLQVQP